MTSIQRQSSCYNVIHKDINPQKDSNDSPSRSLGYLLVSRDYVRKFCNVQNHAFLHIAMREFVQFYAQFLCVSQIQHYRCENYAFEFPVKMMRSFMI